MIEALKHAAAANRCEVKIKWVNAENIEKKGASFYLKKVSGILIPGGFGDRGMEGKIQAARYARETGTPYLGLCLGMHAAVIDFAREVLRQPAANSTEFQELTPYPVIHFLHEQKTVKNKGGTMRLGAYPCKVKKGTVLFDSYQEIEISERHRHRYEFNNKYKSEFEKSGMVVSGTSPDDKLAEVIEISSHPWFLACQFQPEFKSRPYKPHPLFVGFVKASGGCRNELSSSLIENTHVVKVEKD